MEWPPLESDPEIFTTFFRSIGLSSDWEFGEVFALDEDIPASAIILAFRDATNEASFQGNQTQGNVFVKQIHQLDNACGLLAGVHAIANSSAQVESGSLLDTVLGRLNGITPEEAANILINSREIHEAHVSFSGEGQSSQTNAPDYHFIAILPGFKLFDGMKDHPITLECQGPFALGFFQHLSTLLESGKIAPDMNLMVLRRV